MKVDLTYCNPTSSRSTVSVYAIEDDFDADGDLDLVLGGNLYRAKPEVGIYDASHGLYLDNVKGVLKISFHQMILILKERFGTLNESIIRFCFSLK